MTTSENDPQKTIPFSSTPSSSEVPPPPDASAAAGATVWDLVDGLKIMPREGLPRKGDQDYDAPAMPYGRRYRLCGLIGKGGLGTVHLGLDRRIGREVAIKEIIAGVSDADARVLSRFLREARITGQLEHPGIVPVHDIGVNDSGAPFYIMRYIPGRTLHERLGEPPCLRNSASGMAARLQLLDNLIAVCETMAYAHSHKVIHRDLKPANIVIGEFGETVILDWGLAKSLDDTADRSEKTPSVFQMPAHLQQDDQNLTMDSEIMGTPGYMAPEQVSMAWGEIDRQTDVYALGCILHTILTGRPPYRGTVMEIIDALESKAPTPAFEDLHYDLPPELRAICNRALSKDRAIRFKDAGELAHELKAYRDGRMVSVYAYSRMELLTRFVARHAIWLAAGVIALMAILVGAGLAARYGVLAHQEKQTALLALDRARQSMTDVTALSDLTTRSSSHATNALNHGLATLSAAMREEVRLAASDGSRPLTSRLEAFWHAHSEVDDFFLADSKGALFAIAGNRRRAVAEQCLATMSLADSPTHAFFMSPPHVLPENRTFACLMVPFADAGGTAFLGAVLDVDAWIKASMAPVASDLTGTDIFCLDGRGVDISDTSVKEVGRNIFSDPLYNPYPELRTFVKRMEPANAGVGYYPFRNPNDTVVQYRIAAWRTIEFANNEKWKVVAMARYVPENPEDLPQMHAAAQSVQNSAAPSQ